MFITANFGVTAKSEDFTPLILLNVEAEWESGEDEYPGSTSDMIIFTGAESDEGVIYDSKNNINKIKEFKKSFHIEHFFTKDAERAIEIEVENRLKK